MKRALTAALLAVTAALAACEGTKVRLQNPHPPGTPAYDYDDAFYSFRNNHDLFQRLTGAPRAQLSAAMADIVKCLETMKGLLAEPFATQFQPILEEHRKVQKDFVERGSVNSGVLLTMKNLCRQVDSTFYPEGVKLKAPPPPAAVTPAPAAPSAPAAVPAAPAQAVPGWMAVMAWRKSHEELAAAWPGKPAEASAAFAKAREALAAAKAAASEDAAPSLQIYLNEYDRLGALTAGFSKVPEGQTAEGVAKALGAVAKGVETHLPK
jgi:hypothetical protein